MKLAATTRAKNMNRNRSIHHSESHCGTTRARLPSAQLLPPSHHPRRQRRIQQRYASPQISRPRLPLLRQLPHQNPQSPSKKLVLPQNLWVQFLAPWGTLSARPLGFSALCQGRRCDPSEETPAETGVPSTWAAGRRSGCVSAEPYPPPSPSIKLPISIRRTNSKRHSGREFRIPAGFATKRCKMHPQILRRRPKNSYKLPYWRMGFNLIRLKGILHRAY